MIQIILLLLSIQPPGSSLAITFGEPVQTVHLSREALARLPRTSIKVIEGNGKRFEYSGVALDEVLKLANVPMGSELRGRSIAPMVVVANAQDGTKAVYALAEVEPTFSDKIILLADLRDGKPLVADDGPFRLIVPSDKRHARWLRQVRSIDIKKL